MIDPLISLAFSMHARKGVYALLVGSGISRTSGIPTGWEIVLELIRKLALLEGADCGADAAAWFKKTRGEEPDYAKLLDAIAKTPAERQQLLRSYFEPSEEERKQGVKVPTEAHRAIATLVATGHVRVIITTNFDPLLEQALRQIGIVPTVISTVDQMEGAMPLIHESCVILKVHGDYQDIRIRNTPDELAQYEEALDQMLDEIFENFGLVTCGWSAEWDIALKSAIERCRNRRFTSFWTSRGEPKGAAQRMVECRKMEVIQIKDADTFFRQLAEKVAALEDIAQQHPLSPKMAVASLKKYIVEESHRIRLHDLIVEETERTYSALGDQYFPAREPVRVSAEELNLRVSRYEKAIETLLALLVTGCYWGHPSQESLWLKALERIANPQQQLNGFGPWTDLASYPALVLLYGMGMAGLASRNYALLSRLLIDVKAWNYNETSSIIDSAYPDRVMRKEVVRHLNGVGNRYAALSLHLADILRGVFREYLPRDEDYHDLFNRFEYLFGLMFSDRSEMRRGHFGAPVGRFGWGHYINKVQGAIKAEVEEAGVDWPLLRLGHFNGTVERFNQVQAEYNKYVSGLAW